jgi:glutathione synthase/RimK-type ligase-like ATP-grasp enzyme
MKEIAYLTGASWRGQALAEGSLPELEMHDYARMLPAAEANELKLVILRWEDQRAKSCAAALIRSCWDYTERREAFCAALDAIAQAGTLVFNPPALVRWNSQKTYLRDLEALGVRCIATHWAQSTDPAFVARAFEGLDCAELVLKPQIGAGSRNTIRLRRNAWSSADLIGAPEGPVMAQPFLPAIETEGEISLLYFGGKFSHAVRKIPPAEGWLANDRRALVKAYAPSSSQLDLAVQALAAMPLKPLYARVDLVRDGQGSWALIELEAIEPALYLAHAEEGARALCAALAARLA